MGYCAGGDLYSLLEGVKRDQRKLTEAVVRFIFAEVVLGM
jgi:hypothetical protein